MLGGLKTQPGTTSGVLIGLVQKMQSVFFICFFFALRGKKNELTLKYIDCIQQCRVSLQMCSSFYHHPLLPAAVLSSKAQE